MMANDRKQPPKKSLNEILAQPLGTPLTISRNDAIAIVEAGIGGRPDLPSGREYVRKIAKVWRGLKPRG